MYFNREYNSRKYNSGNLEEEYSIYLGTDDYQLFKSLKTHIENKADAIGLEKELQEVEKSLMQLVEEGEE